LLNRGFFSGAIEENRMHKGGRVGKPQTFLPCYQTHIPDSYTRVVPEEESYTWNSLELCRTWLNSFCCVPTTTLSVSFLPTLCVDGLLPSLAEEEEEKEEERFLSGEDTLYALSFARHCPSLCFFFFLQFFLLRIVTIMKEGATPSNVNVCAPLSIDVFSSVLSSVLSSSSSSSYEGRSHSKQCECLAVCVKQLYSS
jgi:hypothetical protein